MSNQKGKRLMHLGMQRALIDLLETRRLLASINGTIFNDANGDGIREANEAPLVGWGCYLDLNQNGKKDTGDLQAITDKNGKYAFLGLAPGTYWVSQNVPTGWMHTGKVLPFKLTVLSGQNLYGQDIGEQAPIEMDVAGNVFIQGTGKADVISAVIDIDNQNNGSITFTVNSFTKTLSFSSISSITADAGDGNDSIDFEGTDVSPIATNLIAPTINGGAGDDAIAYNVSFALDEGLPNQSAINCGDGNDTVSVSADGEATNLVISGGDGNDSLECDSRQSFTLLGGLGDDFLGSGKNNYVNSQQLPYLDGGDGDDQFTLGGACDPTVIGGAGFDALDITFDVGAEPVATMSEDEQPYSTDDRHSLLHTDIEEFFVGGYTDVYATGGPNTTSVGVYAEGESASASGVGDVYCGSNSGSGSVTGGGGVSCTLYGTSVYGSDQKNVITATNDQANPVDVYAGDDDDEITVTGESEAVDVDGGDGNDHIVINNLSSYANTVSGGAGDDVIECSLETSVIDGGNGIDTFISRGYGSAIRIGFSYRDESGNLTSEISHVEKILGDSGDNYISASLSDFTPVTLIGGDGNDAIIGGPGNDFLYGGNGNDSLNGGAGNNQLRGEAGNDTLTAGHGSDFFSGGAGFDQVSYADRTNGVKVGIGKYADDGETNEHDNVYLDVECVVGGKGNDGISANSSSTMGTLLVGLGGNDTLVGGPGNDSIYGGSGNDRITGNGGADQLFGEAGNDSIFSQDKIKDSVDGGDGDDTALVDLIDNVLKVEHAMKS